jgi:hypothetical protein
LISGNVQDVTHKLSTSDQFGEFHHWFCMPLFKVKELTDMLMLSGCITKPQSLSCCAEFSKCSEFFSIYFGEVGINPIVQVVVPYFYVGRYSFVSLMR